MGLYDWMTPEEKQMMVSNQLMGLGTGMLQNSGWSTDPSRKQLGPAIGQGLAGMMGAAKSSMGDIQDKRKMEMQKMIMDNTMNFQNEYGSGMKSLTTLWDELEKMKQRQGGGNTYMNVGGF